jgi:hypothetical protein
MTYAELAVRTASHMPSPPTRPGDREHDGRRLAGRNRGLRRSWWPASSCPWTRSGGRLAAINRDAEAVLAITDGAHPGADDTAQIALDTVEPSDTARRGHRPLRAGQLYFTSGTEPPRHSRPPVPSSGPFRSHELRVATIASAFTGSIGFIGPYADLSLVSGGTACPYDVVASVRLISPAGS